MNQKGEYILAGITTILIAVAGVVYFEYALRGHNLLSSDSTPSEEENNVQQAPTQTTEPGIVKMTVDFGDGTTIEESRDVAAPLDAREVVYLTAALHNYPVLAGEKFLPVALGDFANEEDGKRWTLYMNGASVDTLERVTVRPGDVLMLKYE